MERWRWVVVTQATAVMIALVMPVTPSRTGSERGLAELLLPEASYAQEVLVYFVLTNLLLLVLAAVVLLWVRLREGRG